MSDLRLSVVIIGRNEGERLRLCLESVRAMRHNGFTFEMIYVDSASTDGSVALAESLRAKTVVLRPVRPTAALARNAGWRSAGGEFVLFLDGDTTLHSDFVESSLKEFADEKVAVVWGHRRERCAKESIYNRVLDLDWIYPPGDTSFCGGDAIFRRSVLERTGGFDDTLIAGEEPELCRRITELGLRIVHVDRAMTGHDLAVTRFSQYWRRATRAGHAFAEVSARFASTGNPLWSAESHRNCWRALVLLAVILGAPVMAVEARNPVPLLMAAVVLFALAVRSGWKARWKTEDRLALLMYGVHSHLQQIPIFAGQTRFWINRHRGRHASLLEYKRP